MSSAIERTFGWVQEASVIASLKDVISIFVPNSKINKLLRTDKIPRLISKEDGRDEFIKLLEQDTIVIPYNYLKGRGLRKGETRATAPCSGIVQAVLKGQRREYQSDWPADSYLRWAISIGLLNYNRDSDTCSISTLGLRYVNATSTSEEEKVLTRAFLSNPPVVRVLSLLYKYQHLTKFEIGSQLGFVGEGGFTSIPQRLVVQALVNMPEEKSKILQDVEGTSDKYARMICSWLIQLGWVQQIEKKVTEKFGDYEYTEIIPQSYMLTLKGINVLTKA
ncbi:restriction endonuclease FokI recognition domain-containing protein [Thermoanaerobacterium thermosaccharolyticum]|uniref:restriction endonuclease FokI catalytic domain-containing protein n=1 Tax=Thermoanaerobacterium thermosaccharolyticum TaxID=1517 RepID=UPI003DAA4BC9